MATKAKATKTVKPKAAKFDTDLQRKHVAEVDESALFGARVRAHMAGHGVAAGQEWSAMNPGKVCGHCGERLS